MADALSEIIFFSVGLIVISLAIPYFLMQSSSYSNYFVAQATISQVLNEFHLNTPLLFLGEDNATITNFGSPVKVLMNVSAVGCIASSPISKTIIMETGTNLIPLPVSCSSDQEYTVSLSGANNVKYIEYTIEDFQNSLLYVTGYSASTKILVNNIPVNPVIISDNAYIPLPSGVYNTTVYNPYYFYNGTSSITSSNPQNIQVEIPALVSADKQTLTVYQSINGNDVLLSLAKVSLNYNSTIVSTSSSGNAIFPYMSNYAQLNISCPINTCAGIGNSVSNNYTSVNGIYNISKTSSFYLYPLYATKVQMEESCTNDGNVITVPISGSINFVNATNPSNNKYEFINASGTKTIWLASGFYNVSGATYSNLVATSTFNSISQNQTFELTFNSPASSC